MDALREVLTEAKRHQLDLTDVTFCDEAGINFLRELQSKGVEISRCSGFVAASLGMETT